MAEDIYESWNPWHGCRKISPGCANCYVYRQDAQYQEQIASSQCRKTGAFTLPVKKRWDGSYKIPSGKIVFTCFTSDFLLKDADAWRPDCWEMIKRRSDCWFYFFTKRIDRFLECVPPDWGDGYENVMVGCTVENQERADFRLPIFNELPIKHRSIIAAPLLEGINLSKYLNDGIEQVAVGGESGNEARPCNYDWVLALRRQCVEKNVPFQFHQTGARLLKDGKMYRIRRKYQISQAVKAGIDYRMGELQMPVTAQYEKRAEYRQMSLFEENSLDSAMGLEKGYERKKP